MSLDCETMIPLLFFLQFSVVIPIPFPYRGSNSEEAQPYGPYNHLNLQMPHVGAMYGLGLPHYSQIIQMQQPLARQPMPWLPHIQRNAAPSQLPQPQTKHQFPQQASLPLPQPKPNYQHVTKQPLQLPPAPDTQTQQMFPPFLNPMNPFWPQGNYFGYFGFGGRPPYNSEEANEDEEAPKEKDPPKLEPPVTESSNTTVDTNSTIVVHGQGNSTAQNESLVGEFPQTPNVMSGPNISPVRENMIPSIHGRHGRIIPVPPQPSHHIIRIPIRENLHKNIQQRYYTVNRVLAGHGDQPNRIYPSNQLINKAAIIPNHPSDKRAIHGVIQPAQGDRVLGRPASPLANIRGMFHDPKLSASRTDHNQRHNVYNTGLRGDLTKILDHSQAREHPTLQINRNNVPDHNVIIVHPQHNEHISEYSRYQIAEESTPNIPSGILLGHHNEQHQPKSETSQNTNIYDIKGTYVNHNSDIHARNEDPYAPSETFDVGSTWSNGYMSMGAGESGQPPEIIYLISSLPSDTDAVHDYSNQKQNQWEHAPDQKESPQNIAGQRGAKFYTEDELIVRTSTSPQSENQHWQAIDFSTGQMENMKPQPYRQPMPSRNLQIPLTEQSKNEMYITTDGRHPNSPKHFLFISKPNLPKTQGPVQFSGNEPSYQFREPGAQKLANHLDQTGYYIDYGTNANTNALGKNTQTVRSRPLDPVEKVHITNNDNMHLRQDSPIHLQILSLPETQPWGYNTQGIPSDQRQYNNYDSYPSNMKVQLPYQREIGREHGGQPYFMCTLPFVGDDPGRGVTNSLLYLCCKLTQTDQGSPSRTVDNIPEFRLSLKEYYDFVPQRDRTHRQHTRNVGDPPKTGDNQPTNSLLPNCNASNTPENALIYKSESGGTPCATNTCDEQNLEHPHEDSNNFGTVPCKARGDNYLPPKQDTMNSQKKSLLSREKTVIPLTHVQDEGSRHSENNMRINKGTGKLLQILTCPRDRQMHEADTPASLDKRNKIDLFTLKHDISNGEPEITNQDGFPVLQLAESDPAKNAPDCLILNK